MIKHSTGEQLVDSLSVSGSQHPSLSHSLPIRGSCVAQALDLARMLERNLAFIARGQEGPDERTRNFIRQEAEFAVG